jgi:hypothetical protein
LSHRVFVDDKGESWDVWLVLPTSAERRKVERRAAAGAGSGGNAYAGEERRGRIPDRRMSRSGPRSPIDKEYNQGWLCFESSSGEKRRLVPVPEKWEQMTSPELIKLCRTAKLVVRCGIR